MPELPEVETVVRELDNVITGRKIISSDIWTKKIRIAVPENLDISLKNRDILAVTRRAKYILVHLSKGHTLVIHLGMSGRIHIHKSKDKAAKQKHDHFVMRVSGGYDIVFNDPRRFGLIAFIKTAEIADHALFSHLGPEPLSKDFTPEFLEAVLRPRKAPVKLAIMDQTLVVGVGNIYASEALFDAGIDPRTSSQSLSAEKITLLARGIKKVLREAIKAGGSTLKDYRKTNGDLGYFQHRFTVYDREGKACKGCTCDISQTGGVQKFVQGGRSTFYCPRKQI